MAVDNSAAVLHGGIIIAESRTMAPELPMTEIPIDVGPVRANWAWLRRMIFAALLLVMLALYLGILSLIGVGEMTADCRQEQLPIFKLEDGISDLLTEQKYLQCRLAWGNAEVTIQPGF